jgi:hypothetical protein
LSKYNFRPARAHLCGRYCALEEDGNVKDRIEAQAFWNKGQRDAQIYLGKCGWPRRCGRQGERKQEGQQKS